MLVCDIPVDQVTNTTLSCELTYHNDTNVVKIDKIVGTKLSNGVCNVQ